MLAEYIDRQAVREILYNHYSRDVYTHEGIAHKVSAEIDVDELNSIPTVKVREAVKGEWLPMYDATEQGDCYQCGCYCSNCGLELQSEPNYCPKCGADMRGKQEG